MGNKPPSFQFYPKDWDDFKVQRMSLAAQGAYMKILCYMWIDSKDHYSIVDDNKVLARSLGVSLKVWLKLRSEIQNVNEPIFQESNGKLISKRLKIETIKQRKFKSLQSLKGVLSGISRRKKHEPWLSNGSIPVEPDSEPNRTLLLQSSPSIKPIVLLDGFNNFWNAYPKKVSKGQAERTWIKLKKEGVITNGILVKMVDAVKAASVTPGWKKDGGQFIPHPSTWLNAKGWEDEHQLGNVAPVSQKPFPSERYFGDEKQG